MEKAKLKRDNFLARLPGGPLLLVCQLAAGLLPNVAFVQKPPKISQKIVAPVKRSLIGESKVQSSDWFSWFLMDWMSQAHNETHQQPT